MTAKVDSRRTPMTDAVEHNDVSHIDGDYESAMLRMRDHARSLETALAEAREELEAAKKLVNIWSAAFAEEHEACLTAESALHTTRTQLADADKTLETVRVAMGTSTVMEGLNVIDRLRDELRAASEEASRAMREEAAKVCDQDAGPSDVVFVMGAVRYARINEQLHARAALIRALPLPPAGKQETKEGSDAVPR